jgi:hypothetical protein
MQNDKERRNKKTILSENFSNKATACITMTNQHQKMSTKFIEVMQT